jgi:hypothetical protein
MYVLSDAEIELTAMAMDGFISYADMDVMMEILEEIYFAALTVA